jgi:hypothetical protein
MIKYAVAGALVIWWLSTGHSPLIVTVLFYAAAAYLLLRLIAGAVMVWRRLTGRATPQSPPSLPSPTIAPASLTQINHYHYYNAPWTTQTPETPARSESPPQIALPAITEQQRRHNNIYDNLHDAD